MWRAEIAKRSVWLALELLLKRKRNVRFADARLAGKQHHATFSLRGVPPPAQQQLYFLFTTNQRRQLGLVHRLETALHVSCANHLPNRYHLGPAFQCNRTEIAIVEMPSSQPARSRTDQNRAWLREGLQP